MLDRSCEGEQRDKEGKLEKGKRLFYRERAKGMRKAKEGEDDKRECRSQERFSLRATEEKDP